METTDGNKLALAVLGTLLGTMALGVFSSAIYAPNRAVKPGYALPAGTEATAPAPKAAPEIPFPVELAKADVAKGQADTKICQTCHSFDKGGPIRVGPPLWGVVGRHKGSFPGFNYSEGMKSKGGDWTYDDLNEFLTKPSAYVAGTKMTFGGEAEESKRADIVDYLHTLSDNPLPLPTPRRRLRLRRRRQLRRRHAGADSCGDADACADSCGDPNAGADSRGAPSPTPTAAATPTPAADSCGDAHAGADSCGDAHAGADSCGDAHAGADSCGVAHPAPTAAATPRPPRRRRQLRRTPATPDADADGVRVAVTVGNADAGEIRRARTPHGPRARWPSRFA